MARDPDGAVARPDPRLHRAARRPAARLPGDPPHRHQRQDVDGADDRHAAARARAAHRPLHQPARRADDRADQPRRRADDRRAVRAGVQRRGAVHPPGRRRPAAPAVVLRDRRRRWPTPRSPTPRSTSPSSRSGSAAPGTPPTSPTPPSPSCCRSPSTTRTCSATTRSPSPARRPGSSSPTRSPWSPSSCPTSPTCCATGRSTSARGCCARASTSAWPPGRPAVGGQLVSIQTPRARYDEVFLPLYGAHQAQNAAVALTAVEAFLGTEPLDAEIVHGAFAEVTSPGRLEVIRRSPTIVLDAAHNPHGAAGHRRGARGLLPVRPAHRRDRRDGRQGPRGPAGGVRAAPRPRRVHPELHAARDAGRAARRRRPARSTARTGSPSRRSCPTPSTRPPRWPSRSGRAPRSAPAPCSSPAPS